MGKQKGAPRLPVDEQFQIVQSVLPGELTMADVAR